MTSSTTASQRNYLNDIAKGIYKGGEIMLIQTPLVTAFNRISVISGFTNENMWNSISNIYRGKADARTYSSAKHFFRGVSGHLTKETAQESKKEAERAIDDLTNLRKRFSTSDN